MAERAAAVRQRPIIVTRDNWLVWADPSAEAAIKEGGQNWPAVVLDVDGKTADYQMQRKLYSLAQASQRQYEHEVRGAPYDEVWWGGGVRDRLLINDEAMG